MLSLSCSYISELHLTAIHCTTGFGPRKVMAGLLIVGAIPSGLAGTVSSAQGLYVIRFFIGVFCGLLWWTFCLSTRRGRYSRRYLRAMPGLDHGVLRHLRRRSRQCTGRRLGKLWRWIHIHHHDRPLRPPTQRWSQPSLYMERQVSSNTFLHQSQAKGLSCQLAAFAIVPVPILFAVAIVTLLFGTDHPNGKWSDRHKMNTSLPSAGIADGTPRTSDDLEASPGMSMPKPETPKAEKAETEKDAVNVDVKEAMPSGVHVHAIL